MIHEDLTMFCYADLSGAVRGKGLPANLVEKRLTSGVGWTPTNIMYTAIGTIAPSPFLSFGDVMLKADPSTRVEVDFEDGTPAERFYLCDVTNTDGSRWDCCPRSALKDAVEALRKETGLTLKATFEHEFVYEGANAGAADMYALEAIRKHGAFGETFLAALSQAGVEVDSYLSEFAAGQFEVTMPPCDPLAACDKAIIVKEMARATAWRLGSSVSFSPRLSPNGLGNGVHVHFSLWDENDKPVSHDADGPLGVSTPAQAFLAGIVRHMPALLAFTAPSPISYLRLIPHSWTGVWSNIGLRDREAGIRICPTFGPAEKVARQFNFEYRAADATGNPYLMMAMILQAGRLGLRDKLPMPEPTVNVDPEEMSEDDRKKNNIVRLPASVGEALAALKADEELAECLPPALLDIFVTNRTAEEKLSAGWSAQELCERYARVY
ncbi:glutamine synthetase [Breoghania corrubedonensis]|uniref:Glutamine synthetase n=1 Tax=Breoghania corrubedonensis TaxID=665038 RepID=A0A2T5VC68_9HYPH|nr:glutamine synthetase family protein [Breoghania corrubedonensis]PTW61349.1 glutamine synthetase [Breoghania corrubedonensis]